jgi:vancomycin resistance protein YoaR
VNNNFRSKLSELSSKVKNFFSSRTIKIIALSFGIFIITVALGLFVYVYSFQNKILPNIHVGKIDVGGLTKDAAKNKLASNIKNTQNQNLILSYQDKEWQESFQNLEINYNIDKTVDSVYAIGHGKNYWQNVKDTISTLFTDRVALADFSYSNNKINELFNRVGSDLNVPTKDANLKQENGQLTIVNEQTGKSVDTVNLEASFYRVIGLMDYKNINIFVNIENPKIIASQLENIKPQMEKLIEDPIVLNSSVRNFEFDSGDIINWIDLTAVSADTKKTGLIFSKAMAKENSFTPELIINPEKIKIDIEKISKEINKEPVDAKLSISGGKAVVSTPGQDGYNLDKDKTLSAITKTLSERLKVAGESTGTIKSIKTSIELPLTSVKPTVTNETIDNLGIKELIGKGTTNFIGSTTSRITNIKVGSSVFNGALIKPGETFSTTKTLGEISTSKGYLPELVIKEDTTKPEVGGGLCQVSTTLFRAALNSGLPIVERHNHKYRVSYYEPPVGMDATIYDPSPDLKFENNTSGYILIQTSISGNELTFEFYGTSDGRKVEISDPVIYDITSPGAPVYKEDSSLPQGEIVQKEKAHDGSKASFHYKVTSSSGKILTETDFTSTYTPWQAVFYYGPGTTLPDQNQSESKPENSPTPSESPTNS